MVNAGTDRDQNDDDCREFDIEAGLFEEVAGKVAKVCCATDPQKRTDNVEQEKASVGHLAHAGYDRGECADDWDEHRYDDSLWAVFFIKFFGTSQVLLVEKAIVLLLKKLSSHLVAKGVASAGSGDSRNEKQEHEYVNIYMEHLLLRQKTGGEEQAVSRQEKADHQAGFSVDNSENGEPAKVGDNF